MLSKRMIRDALALSLGLGSVVFTLSVEAATYNDEVSKLVRSGRTAKALGPDLFGDRVNGYTGALEFVQTDVAIPGNNALAVSVGRRLVEGTAAYQRLGLFGDWELEIPRLQGTYSAANGWNAAFPATTRCTNFEGPGTVTGVGGTSVWDQEEYWKGHLLYMPGQGETELLARTANSPPGPSDGTYNIVTKSHWAFKCGLPLKTNNAFYIANATDRGEGFVGRSPDGTVWYFDWLVRRYADHLTRGSDAPLSAVAGSSSSTTSSGSKTSATTNLTGGATPNAAATPTLERTEIWILPTMAKDRFGNEVTYTYDPAKPWHLTQISSTGPSASDNRSITLEYHPTLDRVATVSDGTRTWAYNYGGSRNELVSVTLPGGQQLTFTGTAEFAAGQPNPPDYGCVGPDAPRTTDGLPATITFTHPSGAQGNFTYGHTTHARSYVPKQCLVSGTGDPIGTKFPRYFTTKSLISKQISGPGMNTLGWSYAYSEPNGSGSWDTCTGSCPTTKTVTVSTTNGGSPVGTKVQTYGTRHNVTDGKLLKTEEYSAANALLRKTEQTYHTSREMGASLVNMGDGATSSMRVDSVELRTITQQGKTFTWNASSINAVYERPVTVVRSMGATTRIEAIEYEDNPGVWVLGQTKKVTLDPGGTSLTQMEKTFDSSKATVTAVKEFGFTKETIAYNGDGTVLSRSDGANNTTTFSNYKRGLAKNVSYPDGKAESIEVNDLGWITSHTDAAGYTTEYVYDNTWGLISTVNPPSGFTSTTLDFTKSSAAAYGLAAGHWVHTTTKGNAKTETYLDGLWRPVMTRTYDNASPATTRKVVVKSYDFSGGTSFESYPKDEFTSVAINSPGTRTLYDALGRTTRVETDSELGVLGTDIEYLADFKTKTTNPRGHATTQSFWTLDEPGTAQLALAVLPASPTMPAGVTVAIDRDMVGKPKSITREGTANAEFKSVTRKYVYDQYQRLCKTLEPELIATVQDYDAAGNVKWRAPGVSFDSEAACNISDIAEGAKIKYGYDPMNRLETVTYGDGSAGVVRTYTADGLLKTIASNGSTWTYDYNGLRMMYAEQLNYAGKDYKFQWGITAGGTVSTLTYPDNSVLSYDPDALGSPKQVAGPSQGDYYASNVLFHPNGALKSFNFGNGIAHNLTQNLRGLPLRNSDGTLLIDEYTYDANGNVAAIEDKRSVPAAELFNRTMEYDQLDRLKSASAPGTWGSATYTYDALDNLRTATVGARVNTLRYADGTNRLTRLETSGSGYVDYAYDPRGNISGKGAQGYSFDLGNRLTSATGKGNYLYDGHGRRILVTNPDGSTRLQIYSNAGQLLWAEKPGDTVPANVSYSCTSGTLQGSQCVTTTTYPANETLSCDPGYTLSGRTCSRTTIGVYAASPTGYQCPDGYTLSGTTCSRTVTDTKDATVTGYLPCNSGYLPIGSNCSKTVTDTQPATPTGYSCNAGDGVPSGSTCYHTSYSPATPVYSCPSGYTRDGTTCYGTTTVAATPTLSCNGYGSLQADGYTCLTVNIVTGSPATDPTPQCDSQATMRGLVLVEINQDPGNPKKWQCVLGAVTVYACPGGGTLNGNVCTSNTSQPATISSYLCSEGIVSGSNCAISTPYQGTITDYSCPADYTRSGSTCSRTQTDIYAATPSGYSCPSDYTLNGTVCTRTVTDTQPATPTGYWCPSGGELSGTTCTVTTTEARDAYSMFGCNAGDPAPVNGSCSHSTYTNANKTYSCATGTLSGTSCVGSRISTAYVYLAGKQISEVTAAIRKYVHTDALGSPVAHTNQAGTVTDRTRYEPYGYTAGGTKPGTTAGTTGSAIGFTGHVNDPETDLVYMQQRYYDPIAGRFLSIDPVVTDANTGTSFGRYTYVENNPYAKIDPTGMYSCGSSLTKEQCTKAMSEQATAIRKLDAGVKMVNSIISSINSGKALTAEQTSFAAQIDKVAGEGASQDLSLLGQMVSAGNNSLADLRSDVKLEFDPRMSGAYAVHANDSVKLAPSFFSDSAKGGAPTLMHEGFHKRGGGYLMDRNWRGMPADPEAAARLRFQSMGRKGALMDADTMTVLFGGYKK